MGSITRGDVAAVVLAAGKNTRMKSQFPKAMQKAGGVPMIGMVHSALVRCGVKRIVVVVGFGAEHIMAYLGDKAEYVYQGELLGTGHALLTALDYLDGGGFGGRVLALYGDMPLVSTETLAGLLEKSAANGDHGSLIYADLEESFSYGRVVFDDGGNFMKIVERKDASDEEARIRTQNIGVYCFDAPAARLALRRVKPNNVKHEIYLTDVFAEFRADGKRVGAYGIADSRECLGADDRAALARLNAQMRREKCEALMLEDGVTIVDPDTTYIDSDVTVGMDTVIYPGCVLEGGTVIGERCEIGPNARICASRVGAGTHIEYSVLREAVVGDNVSIGPFAYLRPGASIGDSVKIGDFVEIKNSNISKDVKISHLAYVGDADIGEDVNIGCGVITCNYDGVKKYRTTVGPHAFVGSNTNLIAPVTVGTGAYIASGSTITEDVPEDALAIARERQVIKEHWVSTKGPKKRQSDAASKRVIT